MLTTCTSSSYFCIATSNGQNPIVMVQFQGGSSGSASVFTMTYSSDPTLYCAENNCNSHCSARTANACNNLTSCQLQQPSSSSSQPVTCLCVWNYKNSANSQASDMSQPDYQTNGGCVDLGTEVVTAIATAFAIGTGILVRSRRIFAGFKIGLVNLMWAGRDHRHPNHRHSHPRRDLRHVLLPVRNPPFLPPVRRALSTAVPCDTTATVLQVPHSRGSLRRSTGPNSPPAPLCPVCRRRQPQPTTIVVQQAPPNFVQGQPGAPAPYVGAIGQPDPYGPGHAYPVAQPAQEYPAAPQYRAEPQSSAAPQYPAVPPPR